MLLKSFSKINLSLSINKKIPQKKLHDLQSYFCLINLFDEIRIKKTKKLKDIIKFEGKFANNVEKNNNSIVAILKILREKKLISHSYRILVKKKIPVFAGMGGGTSNAVFLIKYFLGNNVKKSLLKTLSQKIGSDLKLFFYNQGFLKNIETINNFPRKHRLFFLLVYPNIKCSTRYVYSKVKKYSFKSIHNFNIINTNRKFVEYLSKKNNDLQSIVEKRYPAIKKLIIEIRKEKGCYFSRMTGSGSVCYGVFKSEKTAKAALNMIKLKHPKYWSSIAKTI